MGEGVLTPQTKRQQLQAPGRQDAQEEERGSRPPNLVHGITCATRVAARWGRVDTPPPNRAIAERSNLLIASLCFMKSEKIGDPVHRADRCSELSSALTVRRRLGLLVQTRPDRVDP